jgi:transposase
MKHSQPVEFAALIGIDWAHAKHDICLQPGTDAAREHSILQHTPEAIDAWVRELRQRFGPQPIAIALELDKGPLVYALQKYDGFVLFPVNPNLLAKYREAFTPSKAKDDPTDAELALEILLRHREALTCLTPQSAPMRALLQLVFDRRRLVHDKVRLSNRLTNALKNYFPQALDWFEDKATVVCCDFLSRWPTLKQAQRARKATLQAFFHEHNVRYPQVIAQRIDAIRAAMPLTEDPAILQPQALLVSALVAQLRTVLTAIEEFDTAIHDTASQLSDYALFRNLPGAGPVLAPRLLAAFGEDRNRYHHASEIQQYAGIAPVTERSGQKSWVHWRYRAPSFLRQSFVEWAGETVPRSFWAKAYYQQQRTKGLTHQAAVRALAFKWIRIVFRCWQQRTPYDESVYLLALQKRGSPLLKNFTATAAPACVGMRESSDVRPICAHHASPDRRAVLRS